MKVVAMRESKDLSKISTFELFSDLKAFEFDIDRWKDGETPSSKVTALHMDWSVGLSRGELEG
ncbi:hypothetical protein ACS0TY_029579 [Phlomoides rotata]